MLRECFEKIQISIYKSKFTVQKSVPFSKWRLQNDDVLDTFLILQEEKLAVSWAGWAGLAGLGWLAGWAGTRFLVLIIKIIVLYLCSMTIQNVPPQRVVTVW